MVLIYLIVAQKTDDEEGETKTILLLFFLGGVASLKIQEVGEFVAQ